MDSEPSRSSTTLRVVSCIFALALGAATAEVLRSRPLLMKGAESRLSLVRQRVSKALPLHWIEERNAGKRPRATLTAVAPPKTAKPAIHAPTEPTASSAFARGLGGAYRDGLLIEGGTPHRLILFTFDDGPDWKTTPALLDRLDAAGVKAVFFLSGWRLGGDTPRQREQSRIARDTVARGHIVGNHTVDHVQLPVLNDHDVYMQITKTEEIFEQLFGDRPWLLRPPGGARSKRIDTMVANRGYTTMLWNLGTGDFQVRSAKDVFAIWQKVKERREREHGERGGIVLMHDTHAWSVEAFQLIYDDLMQRNCTLLAAGEELYDVVDDPSFFFAPRLGAPPGTAAPKARLTEAVLESRQRVLREKTRARCQTLARR